MSKGTLRGLGRGGWVGREVGVSGDQAEVGVGNICRGASLGAESQLEAVA